MKVYDLFEYVSMSVYIGGGGGGGGGGVIHLCAEFAIDRSMFLHLLFFLGWIRFFYSNWTLV